jgi:predicted ArsR family transcriptional regulator/anti-sigma regulatory factor (Ser/Thr protein kinase)
VYRAVVDYYLDPGVPGAVSDLRRDVVAYLRRHADDPTQVDDAELAVAELVGNAVDHSGGPVWVSVDWSGPRPLLAVHDLGEHFSANADLPEDALAESGRGMFLAAHLTEQLAVAARRVGNRVSARLPVHRSPQPDHAPIRTTRGALPQLDEAGPEGFGREPFLRALVVQLASTVEAAQGPDAANADVAQVGIDIGAQMEAEYRRAKDVVGRMSPEQIADCLVRLKRSIGGEFFVIEVTENRIVLGTHSCPFGTTVQRAPALCRMTSSVFGGIAARNADGATVVLEERIAVGDPGCRVVVLLGDQPEAPEAWAGHRYPPVGDLAPPGDV